MSTYRTRLATAGAILAAVSLIAACGGGTSSPPAAKTPSPGQGTVPADHPPMGSAAQIPAPPEGAGSGAAGLQWTVPSGWVAETPSSTMRKAQYRVPGAGGDGQCVVFYFGPGQGGDPMGNALRWAKMFTQPDGKPSSEVLQTSNLKVGDIPVLLAEIGGTYRNPMVSSDSFPDYRLIGAIAEGPDANWFFKFTGPERTVREQREAFLGMIRSLKKGA